MNDDLDFQFGDGTAVDFGCGATLFGEFWYFGGQDSFKRQVCEITAFVQSKVFNYNFCSGQ